MDLLKSYIIANGSIIFISEDKRTFYGHLVDTKGTLSPMFFLWN